jgi:hypothetical protein
MPTDTRQARRLELLAELRTVRARLKMPGLSLSQELAFCARIHQIYGANFALWAETEL